MMMSGLGSPPMLIFSGAGAVDGAVLVRHVNVAMRYLARVRRATRLCPHEPAAAQSERRARKR